MSESPAATVCLNCGADRLPSASVCWLCKQNLAEVTATDVEIIEVRENTSFTFSIASILLATALFAVFFGVLMMAPGLAILLAILCVPALVRTGLAFQQRSEAGKPVPTGRKFLWFLSSLTVTTIVVVVVVVASFGTFCAVCLGSGTEAAIPVALLAAGAATIGVLVASHRWIRHRWRRDVSGN